MCYHQIFIIAHINDRYRCLAKAVFFEPWPYGISVPSRCGRLISLFESSSNALAISSELSYAKTLPPSFWEDKESDQESDQESDKEGDDDPAAKIEYPEHPFSYIETCLTVGASWDPMKRLYNEVDVSGTRDTKSNYMARVFDHEGNTILDITNLQRVRYAFEKFLSRRDLLKSPCTASEYLQHYNYARKKKISDDLQAEYDLACSACLDHDLLDITTIISVWPNSPFMAVAPTVNDEGDVKSGSPDTHKKTVSGQPATLKKASMDKIFDELLICSHEEFKGTLKTATLLSDFWPIVKSKLFNNPVLFHLGPDKGFGAVRLLVHAHEHEKTIDLCPYQLTEDQLEYFLISGPTSLPNLKVLNLSGSRHLTEGLLRKIIFNHKSLTTLYLLNTPHIPLKAKLSILRGSRITEFSDTEMLSFAFIGVPEPEIGSDFDFDPKDEKNIVGGAQKQAVQNGERRQEETRHSRKPPSLSHMPLPVSQIMLVGLEVCKGGVVDINKIRLRNYDPIYAFPFNLNGLNRSLSSCLLGIIDYTQWLLSRSIQNEIPQLDHSFYGELKKPLGVFLGRDSSPDGEAGKILPIPPELYEDRGRRVPSQTPLCPGQWTLMIGHALPHIQQEEQSFAQVTTLPPALYYAFLSTEGIYLSKEQEQYSQSRLITEDIDGLLRRLEVDTPTREQIVTLWHERLGKLRIKDYWGPDLSKLLECSIEPCSTEDAEFLLEYAMKGVQSEGS
ncbi:hypothetical protein HYALB_00012214 [Hymenoscyphus albidus]|uniref:Uncharacterized protein n=1 Tax=Hymenoscyphus albidus TaxID=595503 RepID=A0A9N9LP86_9HELO|nr:hypothetical protein HYALB_00012214 [Hymenoscyphus albidus]